jgi:DcmR-like sensory protein
MNGLGTAPEKSAATLAGALLYQHDHVCVFYHGSAQRDAVLSRFLREGVTAGNRCRSISFRDDEQHLLNQLGDITGEPLDLLEFARFIARDQLHGGFHPDWVLQSMGIWAAPRAALNSVMQIPALGVGANASHGPDDLVANLIAFEDRVTEFVRRNPCVGVCFFDLDNIGADLAMPAIQSHPKLWLDGVILENPFLGGDTMDQGG